MQTQNRKNENTRIDLLFEATGFLVFYGYVGSLIMGQMFKIGPFLTWLHKYSDKVGIEDVPALHEMVDQRSARLQFILWRFAVPFAALGMALRHDIMTLIGCSSMSLGSIIFLFVQYKIFLKEPVKVR